MTIILGLTTSHHDGAISLVVDGKLKGAISKERYTRVKKDGYGNDRDLIIKFLQEHNLQPKDIDYVAFSDDTQLVKSETQQYIKFYKNEKNFQPEKSITMTSPHHEVEAEIDGRKIPAYQVQHQLSHCAYTFFTSNKKNAVCVSMDASGPDPLCSSIIAKGEDTKIEIIKFPELQIGNFYNMMTPYIGLGPGLFKAGSLMGLASYGEPNDFAKEKWQECKEYDMRTRPFIEEERKGYDYELTWLELTGGIPNNHDEKFFKKDSDKAKEIAASVQYIFEKVILDEIKKVYEETKNFHEDNICLTGGSFLNCNVNTLIKDETNFKTINLSPACGDDGLAAGAALYVAHHILKLPRKKYKPKEVMYLGGKYDVPKNIGEKYEPKKIAKLLSEGKVIAWFQGRSEFGPRALGNRSLLADPRNPNMRDHLNFNVKHREWFRPYAPSVLAEKSKDWFDFDDDSPYMLFTMNVKKPKKVPAITHVDGTARIQTVRKEDNPRYYELIQEFEKITKVPMILNTSLNGNGEPILETPEDAFNFLKKAECDLLVIEDRVIKKEDLNDQK